jgi:sulfate permease
MDILIFIISCFFALNMGASSFAASFSTAYGCGAVSKRKAQILYMIFIVLGAVLMGQEVSKTLGKGIVPSELLNHTAVLIILFTATLSLFVANLMHIPQSTSLSTVSAISGVGLYFQEIQIGKIQYLAICWILSTLISFVLIYLFTSYVYPPRKSNLWIYEKIVHHKKRLIFFVILTSCYNVFSQGSNNVPNVVGPLLAINFIEPQQGLLILGIVFSFGAFLFNGPLKTISTGIIPLGILTATIINLVSGTITLIASFFGIPQPAVIIYTMAVFAVATIKDGPEIIMASSLTYKTIFTWFVNPIITLVLSYGLSKAFLGH